MTPPPVVPAGDASPDAAAPADAVDRAGQEHRLLQAWATPTGWRYWSSVNNTVVGKWYIAVTLLFFLFGGVLALIMRLQLGAPEQTLVTADQYNQIFTVHGSVMMFLFAIPIFEAVSIAFLPAMIGARELPFPRLSAFGFWAFAIGGAFLCGSLLLGSAPKGGWFMYPPLTSGYQPDIGADIWLLGFSFIEVAAIAAAVELIVGVLRSRPPGMRLNLMPLYAWYVLVAAFMVLFAFPPLIAGTLMLELERAVGWPFFDPRGGGDPLLWQHLFWIFGHPEVYIVFLPSVALVAMIVPTAARHRIVGYSWVVMAALGTGFLSFGLWVHHMFTTGLPGLTLAIFSAASASVAIPTTVQFLCFAATLARGRIALSIPMLYIVGGTATFAIGGLTGLMVAMAPFDLQAHDSFFVVAHLHTVLIGGSVFPLLAGLYYYYPLLDGKQLSAALGRWAFWLVFVGFNLTFMPMHVLGLLGMPRRIFTYEAGLGWETLNLVATVGAFVLAAGMAVIAVDVVRSKRRQPLSPRNPWGAGTLEWLPPLPNQPWGMRTIPEIDGRYPLWDQPSLQRDYDEGRGFLPDAEEGRREMLVTSTVDAEPQQCMRIAGPTFVTLAAAVAVAGMFGFATFKAYALAAVSTAVALVLILFWLWTGSGEIPEKPAKHVGLGVHLPLYLRGKDSVGWWAMCITMLAVFAAFVSVLFGYLFYWTLDARFLADAARGPQLERPLAAVGLTALSWAATLAARTWNAADRAVAFYGAMTVAVAIGAWAMAACWMAATRSGLDPSVSAYAATVWLLAIWCAVQVAVGLVMQLYSAARRAAGRMTAFHDNDLGNTALYWHFTMATVAMAMGVIGGFPALAQR